MESCREFIEYSNNKSLEQLWFNQLEMRCAIDQLVFNMHRDNFHIDWAAASAVALDDIKKADENCKMEDLLGGGLTVKLLIYSIFFLLWALCRPLLGCVMAYLLQSYAPGFADLLVSYSVKFGSMTGMQP